MASPVRDVSFEVTNSPLRICRVEPNDAISFYNLIQEQAEQHAFSDKGKREENAQKLYAAVNHSKEVQAFLVKNQGTDIPVCAVTYFDCWTAFGPGLYLEDIVTTKVQRGRGVGHFAMAALAQLTLKKGYSVLAWECAASNIVAHRFYDSLGSHRHEDRQTWRLLGPLKPPKHTSDRHLVKTVLPKTGNFILSESKCITSSSKNGIKISFVKKNSNGDVGKAISYRSYSTFRLVSGMHMESLSVGTEDFQTAAELMCGQIHMQISNKWIGHLDVTVRKEDESTLLPVLRDFGFVPLSYGKDQMVPRYLQGDALRKAAFGRIYSVIAPLL